MKKARRSRGAGAELRRAAEEALAQGTPPGAPGAASPAELLHELQVHRVELDLQNAELRRALVSLEESRDRYLDLYDFSPVGYLTIDAEGRIGSVNLTGAALLGVERVELRSRPFGQFLDLKELGRWARHLELARGGGASRSLELLLQPAGRGPFPAQVTSIRTGAAGGVEVRCSLLDITERKAAEAERTRRMAELVELNSRLETTHRQLLQADKMAAIGQLAAGVAHELNGPLSYLKVNLHLAGEAVAGLLDLVQATDGAEAGCDPGCAVLQRVRELRAVHDVGALRRDLSEELEESRQALDRVARLVSDLRTYAHPDAGDTVQADLDELVDGAVRIVARTATPSVRVVKDPGSGPIGLRCRPSQLEQVAMNLLLNAVQASAPGGSVTVRTGRTGPEIWLEVQDDGPGIAPEHMGRVFEPFFTTKPVGAGTGLGLSIAHGIVLAHAGRIEVRSEPGAGATFRVVLPAEAPARTPPPSSQGRYRG